MTWLRRLEVGEVIRDGDKRMGFVSGDWGNVEYVQGGPVPAAIRYFRPICRPCSKGNGDYTDLIDGTCPVCGGER